MRKIFLLVLLFVLVNGYTQTTPGIAHELAVGKKMMNTTEDLRPLVMLDGLPYTGGIDKFKPADIESIKIVDKLTAHSLWNASGLNGAIIIFTKKVKLEHCEEKLLALGEGFRRFVRDHPGNDNITYRLNGHILTGDKFEIAEELNKIPDDNIKWVKTIETTNENGEGAIVSVRTLDSSSDD